MAKRLFTFLCAVCVSSIVLFWLFLLEYSIFVSQLDVSYFETSLLSDVRFLSNLYLAYFGSFFKVYSTEGGNRDSQMLGYHSTIQLHLVTIQQFTEEQDI